MTQFVRMCVVMIDDLCIVSPSYSGTSKHFHVSNICILNSRDVPPKHQKEKDCLELVSNLSSVNDHDDGRTENHMHN